jgi:multidrug efflux pump subunit AcrB
MERPAAWSPRRPAVVVLAFFVVVAAGVLALGRLTFDFLPRLAPLVLRVEAPVPGASAASIEERVTRPLEEALALLPGTSSMESRTERGRAVVDLTFRQGVDAPAAQRAVDEQLRRARPRLPPRMDPPTVSPHDPAPVFAVEYAVTSVSLDLPALHEWVESVLAKQLRDLPGVADVDLEGGLAREFRVAPDPRRLAGLGLSFEDILGAVGGHATPAPDRRRPSGLRGTAAIAALPVMLPNGESIALSEVAQVVVISPPAPMRVRFHGTPGIRIAVRPLPRDGAVSVAERVQSHLAWMRANGHVPGAIEIHTLSDQSRYARRLLRPAAVAAGTGALLILLVVYLFLRRGRAVLLTGMTLLSAVFFLFVLLALEGAALNLLTLGGLAGGAGLGAAVLFLAQEETGRRPAPGPERRAGPAVAAACLAAGLPALLYGGHLAAFFRDFIAAFLAGILVSTLAAFTLAPVLAPVRATLRPASLWTWIAGRVEKTAGWRRAILPGAVLLAAALAAASLLAGKWALWIAPDDGRVEIRLAADAGLPHEAQEDSVQLIERLIREQDGASDVLVRWRERETEFARLSVQLGPRRPGAGREAWIGAFLEATRQTRLAGLRVRVHAAAGPGLPSRYTEEDLRLHVNGPELESLAALGEDITRRLRAVPGLGEPRHSAGAARLEYVLRLDPEKAGHLGVDAIDADRALAVATEGIVVGEAFEGERRYPVRVRLAGGEPGSAAALERLLLRGEVKGRPAVYLRDVGAVEPEPAPAVIRHDGRHRNVAVTIHPSPGRSPGDIGESLRAALADYPLPPGYDLRFAGTLAALEESYREGAVVLAVSLALVFAVLTAYFRSLRPALAGALTAFVSLAVTLGGLWLAGIPFYLPVWLGLILLTGMAAMPAVVTSVHLIPSGREQGAEAARAAGLARSARGSLIGILLILAGLSPLALGLGEGLAPLRPLAAVVMIGLVVSLVPGLLLASALVHRPRRPRPERGREQSRGFSRLSWERFQV